MKVVFVGAGQFLTAIFVLVGSAEDVLEVVEEFEQNRIEETEVLDG